MALRREAADARLLVVNHHLLFADLAARHDGAGYEGAVVLPPYSRVILDEAHTIEEAATSFFSRDFSRLGIYRQLGRLYRKRRSSTSGLLVRLMSLLPPNAAGGERGGSVGEGADALEEGIGKIREAADSLDEAALELCGSEGLFRLTPRRDGVIAARLSPEFAALRKRINSFACLVRELLEVVPGESEEDPVVWEVRAALRRLDATGAVCSAFIEYRDNPQDVMWIERRPGRQGEAPWAVFTATPVDVAPSLGAALFEPSKMVVCVSATLTTGNSFNYWKGRTGLGRMEQRKILTGIFPSPFPYSSQVLLAAPSDAPLPTETAYGTFVNSAAAALVETSGGSALVLFTSYQALRDAHEAALPVLKELGIRVFKQGDDDRNRLLASFLEDESSVLFATDSFWEGVDAPGNTLRLVILCRLPFRSPGDPVFEARCEAVEQAGGNAFMDLSLPEAVMKFKQGFGRLMRSSSDYGVVAVLDGRLLHKQYGVFFLRSLPETKTCFGDLPTILSRTENFLFGH
jgi:ATP-dependent DNA helicase DinG